jgi:hypothetical protein
MRAPARPARADEADDRRARVVPPVEHGAAGEQRAERRERERYQRDAGLSRGELVHDLEMKRHQDGELDRDAHRERAAGGAPTHHRVVQHGERQERLACARQALAEGERQRERGGESQENCVPPQV